MCSERGTDAWLLEGFLKSLNSYQGLSVLERSRIESEKLSSLLESFFEISFFVNMPHGVSSPYFFTSYCLGVLGVAMGSLWLCGSFVCQGLPTMLL